MTEQTIVSLPAPGEPSGSQVPDRRFNLIDFPLCAELPHRVLAIAWQEHIPFAMALVSLLRPRVLVELGVHAGDSYLAFCQAVVGSGGGTTCFGVDTWRGDLQAGFYGDEVLADLRRHHDPLYGAFSRLVQSTFDEAVHQFPDRGIDLLHIDGLHTYDAVRHDFEAWLPKLSERAVVLFHDINVRERDFGVWRLWAELTERYPHFEFAHGHGLGVLAVGAESRPALEPLLQLQNGERSALQMLFFALGNRITLWAEVRAQLAAREELEAKVGTSESVVDRLNAELQIAQGERQSAMAELQLARDRLVERDALVDQLTSQEMDLVNSRSYRLGRVMTFPVRWIKGRLAAGRTIKSRNAIGGDGAK